MPAGSRTRCVGLRQGLAQGCGSPGETTPVPCCQISPRLHGTGTNSDRLPGPRSPRGTLILTLIQGSSCLQVCLIMTVKVETVRWGAPG